MTKAFKTYLLGSVLLLVGHFLPVAKVLSESINLFELGNINKFGSGPNPVVMILIVLALGVLLAFIANRITSKIGKVILYLLALLVAVLYFFILVKAQWFDGGAEKAFGYWFMMLSVIVMVVGSVMGFAEKKQV